MGAVMLGENDHKILVCSLGPAWGARFEAFQECSNKTTGCWLLSVFVLVPIQEVLPFERPLVTSAVMIC